jgi:ubiquinone/menaquinone biosynthesis C-methylase UbiE
MKLEDLQTNWDKLGQEDAMWAVLTDPDKKGGKWVPAEFFATGEAQMAETFNQFSADGIKVNLGCALDFGCGVGRLTQALARRFSEAHGVDIAPSMIEQARKFNQFPDKCHYHQNPNSDLRLFPDQKFDFIFTYIVLQHIQGEFVLNYVHEFVRILRPGGIVMFQFIEPGLIRRSIPAFVIDAYRLIRQKGKPFVWEFGVSRSAVERVLRESGAKVLKRQQQPAAKKGWTSHTYVITRP